jgi:hypothetical protein
MSLEDALADFITQGKMQLNSDDIVALYTDYITELFSYVRHYKIIKYAIIFNKKASIIPLNLISKLIENKLVIISRFCVSPQG